MVSHFFAGQGFLGIEAEHFERMNFFRISFCCRFIWGLLTVLVSCLSCELRNEVVTKDAIWFVILFSLLIQCRLLGSVH